MKFSARMFGVEAARGSWSRLGVLALTAVTAAGCAQPPEQHARGHSKEYFSEARYGKASPRMVADGEPIPHGGGQYLVGHPYTIAGRTYYPGENLRYSAVGMASWYGDAFQGRRTANGEVYDMRSLSAAHPTMPLPSYARVTNTANGYSVIVRVNDRGPYHGGRVMDVSSRVADVLDFKGAGTARVKVEYVGRAPLDGSDDSSLLASLRTDGSPASLDGVQSSPTMVAAAQESAPSPLPSFLRPAAPPPPAPPPEPAEAREEPAQEVAPTTHVKLVNAPPPPPRPFDLGEISRVIAPVAANATPPHRPVRQASAGDRALYYDSEPASAVVALRRHDPFAALRGAGEGLRSPEAPSTDR